VPTLLYLLIVATSTLMGFLRGYRKSLIFLIHSLIISGVFIVLYFLFKESEKMDVFLLNIINLFLGSDTGRGQSDISAVDNEFLSKSVANHLIEQGYKKFLYVTTSKSAISAVRERGFKNELIRRGFELENEGNVYFEDNLQNQVYPILRKAMANGEPVGIFCYHDIVASSVKAMCDKHDLICPEQVGIVGFDNLSDLPYDDISTVEYSRNSVVKQAIDLLVKKQNKESFSSQYIPGYLIIRRSSSLRKK
jgi:LacI family transcriptional regulator